MRIVTGMEGGWRTLQILDADTGQRTALEALGFGPDLARRYAPDTRYFDRAVARQVQFVPVPPFLAQTLRQRDSYAFDQAGIRRAVERATEGRGGPDSTQAAGARPGLRPSPAPPILPGAKQVGPTHRVLQ